MHLLVHTATGTALVRLKFRDQCERCQGLGYLGLPTFPLVCPECEGRKLNAPE